MIKKIKVLYTTVLTVLFSLYAKTVLASPPKLAIEQPMDRYRNIAGKSGYNIDTGSTKITIIVDIIIYALGFVGVFFLIMIIYSGFQWIAAGGNDEIITKAKTRLKNSIIGFVIIAMAYTLTVVIVKMLEASLSDTYL